MEIIKKDIYFKQVEYKDDILYISNNIDNDMLDQNSEFRIGSISKLFTIIGILILHQNNKLDINDKIDKYILSNNNNDLSKITILDVLNHKAGLVSFTNNFEELKNKKYKNASDIFNYCMRDKIFIENINYPYLFSYSNTGYLLLGSIIEKIYNSSIKKIFKKLIFKKCGMNNTKIGKTNLKIYDKNSIIIEKKNKNKEYYEIFKAQNAGGFYSTINDLILFGKNIPLLINKKSIEFLILTLNFKSNYDLILCYHNMGLLKYTKKKHKLINN